MKVRTGVALLAGVVAFAAVPALRASADTAYMLVTKPSGDMSADAMKDMSQEFELDDFTMTSAPDTTGLKSMSTGAGAGKVTSAKFTATTPLNTRSARLLTMTSVIPELRVRIDGKSADDALTFKSCLMSNAQQTATSVSLAFTCAGVQSSATTGMKGQPGPSTSVPMSHNLETFLDVNGASVHITSFAVDEQTGGKLESMVKGAGAGKATASTMVFTVPLDGSAKVMTDLANHGPQNSPLRVTFVASGSPKSKPLLVEEFSNWTVTGDTSSFDGKSASNAYAISYLGMRIVYDGTTTTGGSATTGSIPGGWNRVKNVQDTTPTTVVPLTTTKKP